MQRKVWTTTIEFASGEMLIRNSSSTEPTKQNNMDWTFEPPATLPPSEPITKKSLTTEQIITIVVCVVGVSLCAALIRCLLLCCSPCNKAKRQQVQLDDGINANQRIHAAVTSTAVLTSNQHPSSPQSSSETSDHRVTNPSPLPHTSACVNLTPSAPPEISYSPNFFVPAVSYVGSGTDWPYNREMLWDEFDKRYVLQLRD